MGEEDYYFTVSHRIQYEEYCRGTFASPLQVPRIQMNSTINTRIGATVIVLHS